MNKKKFAVIAIMTAFLSIFNPHVLHSDLRTIAVNELVVHDFSKLALSEKHHAVTVESDKQKKKEDDNSKTVTASRSEDKVRTLSNVLATYYTPQCKGCSGETKSGYNVKNTIYYKGMRIIAVDPKVIKLGTVVRVYSNDGEIDFKAVALDTGGKIKGMHVDILVNAKNDANDYGTKRVNIDILK